MRLALTLLAVTTLSGCTVSSLQTDKEQFKTENPISSQYESVTQRMRGPIAPQNASTQASFWPSYTNLNSAENDAAISAAPALRGNGNGNQAMNMAHATRQTTSNNPSAFSRLHPKKQAPDIDVNFGGRFMLDYTRANLSNEDIELREGGIRRLRANVSGDIGEDLEYEVEIDIDGSEVDFTDVKMAYSRKGSPWTLTMGQQRTTVSLDEQTSSRFSSTLERAAFTDAFDFSRRLGVSLSHDGDRHHVSVGGYSSNLNEPGGGGFGPGSAASARFVYNPIKTDDAILHLGGSWRYRRNGEDGRNIRSEQKAYSRNFSDDIIQTPRFAESDNFVGAEAAFTTGKFWLAGEYGVLFANGNADEPNANFDGSYLEAGYFIGGEKKYSGDGFGRPKVDTPLLEGGLGAVSFVARYDQLDLEDDIYTGQLNTLILGADWWPREDTRFGINYFDVEADDGSSRSGDGVLLRAQFDF